MLVTIWLGFKGSIQDVHMRQKLKSLCKTQVKEIKFSQFLVPRLRLRLHLRQNRSHILYLVLAFASYA